MVSLFKGENTKKLKFGAVTLQDCLVSYIQHNIGTIPQLLNKLN